MTLKSRINFVAGALLCLCLCYSCSTKKNTAATRAYHELTTRYNVYFNAEQAYNETLQSQFENQKDNYHELLPIYLNSSYSNDTIVKPLGGPFDRTVEKTAKAIQEHSITVKPKRDPSQNNTQAYRDWLRQNEFNPFIDQAWLLMGKAHVQNKDYTEAVAVLSQTARLFNYDIDVVSEAQIWMMRAYTEMGWFSDAESMASTLQARAMPKNLQAVFAEFYTFLLIRKESYREAIPFLLTTIDNQRNTTQKKRLQFLLGQLYTNIGENANAYQAFEKVKGLNTPYEVSFNALIRQSYVSGGDNRQKIIADLAKMAKSDKNKEYLDQIYYAIGNIYFSQNSIEKAIENYLLAEKESTRSGIDKALAQVALGDIYFDRKDFVKAQPRYSEAMGALPKNNGNYARVEFRADVLGELAPHLAAVYEQDSLQRLAKLPQAEQLKIINAHIAEIKKKDKEQSRDNLRDTYLAQQQARSPNLNTQQPSAAESAVMLANRGTETAFYFYSPQLVAQGKNEFRRRWGNRALADNWRLQKASSSNIQASESPALADPSSPNLPLPGSPITDPYSADFYLQQLPTTPEALEASGKIIENGLFKAGNIVKDRLEDFDYAINLYNRHLTDFPESENRQEVYYQLYIIYLRTGNGVMAQNYKNKILSEFPESEHAVAMSHPDYEHTMRNFAQAEDSLYQNTYRAYQRGQSKTVQNNYEQARKLFSRGNLMPKFMLLNALSFAQMGDSTRLKTTLEELAQKYPQSQETVMAQDILAGLSEGKMLAANASAMSGIDWKGGAVSGSANAIDSIPFDTQKNRSHAYLLMFASNSVKKNELLFTVSDFNFSHFQLRTFNASFIRIYPFEALQVKPFRSFDEAQRYARMIASDSVFRRSISAEITPLVISDGNKELLDKGKSLNEYIAFYNRELIVTQPISDKVNPDSAQTIVPITKIEIAPKPEKVVPLEEEIKTQEPAIIPQQIEIRQPQRATIEERQAELERKAQEALIRQNTGAEKNRGETLKQREKERKEKIKQRERELKEREKQRQAELKARERERQQKLKEQEQLRKEKLKERERILRERERNR